jgi:hypothetical protein
VDVAAEQERNDARRTQPMDRSGGVRFRLWAAVSHAGGDAIDAKPPSYLRDAGQILPAVRIGKSNL